MKKVYITEAVRLPIGSFMGFYKNNKPKDLGAAVIKECVKRSKIDINKIDEVVVGNIITTEEKGNPAREACLDAGLPIPLPAYTVNKNCGSSGKAVALAATEILAGKADCVMAVGMETMSTVPYVLRNARYGYRMGDGVLSDLLTDLLVGMGLTAELLAQDHGYTREQLDKFAFNSQMKAAKAWENHEFDEQIVPFSYISRGKEFTISVDEGFKPNTTLEGLAKLKPTFKKDGIVTAGNSSTINDSAAAVLVVSEDKLKELNQKPLAEIIDFASAGCDPDRMGIGPVPAVKKLLKQVNMKIEDIDVFELNEAFASQAMSCIDELGIDIEKVNPNGSGISLGHPVGATGAVLITKLSHYLKKHSKKYGIVTMCIGGGQGFAILLKNPEL